MKKEEIADKLSEAIDKGDGEFDIGNTVICDGCSEDYTNSDESGGFLFTSHAVCPRCAPESLKRIQNFREEKYIRARCPKGVSFKDWILYLRNGNNKITVKSL